MSARTQGSSAAVQRTLRVSVVALFFLWGFSTVLIDTLVPRFRALFSLGYAEVLLTQFAFFLAYFIVSVPAGMLVARLGYVRSIVLGLAVMTVGCLLFVPASAAALYPPFLVALFVLGAGISVLQVAANPLIAQLGDAASSHSRLNLAQAFNSLGTFIGPYFGTWLILSRVRSSAAGTPTTAERLQQAHTLQLPFLIIAALLAITTVIFAFFWKHGARGAARGETPVRLRDAFALLRHARTALGALSIFVYVGAEVTIGSLMINYLMSPHTLGLSAVRAGPLVSIYWGGAMLGRLVGSGLLRRVNASVLLSACAIAAAALAALAALSAGLLAAAAALAVGLCNSIMFPTIFSLSIEGLGARTPQGAALLCLAIVGGAIIPALAGRVADLTSLSVALFVPVVCYVWIAIFGALTRTPARALQADGRIA
jgi:FHS family L-fucose permease-like MFS transporter